MTLTKLEKAFLPMLESATGRRFRREAIDGRYIDFCDDQVLIEYTEDHGKGVSVAIERLRNSDTRRKFIVCDASRVGRKRRARASQIGVSLIPIASIRPVATL
jgi:hypothetical protein